MSPKSVFRIVVGLSFALTIASAIAGAFPRGISEDWAEVLQWHGNGGLTQYISENIPESMWARIGLGVLAAASAMLTIAIQIGMFLFWRFARLGYVCLSALLILTVLFDGLLVMLPTEAAGYQLSLILDGVVIAMAYLQPIASYFDRAAQPGAQPDAPVRGELR